ncbi:hypothetical protein CN971_20300 [Bacillus thuringiensis]|uniref:Uncharacterized protein n=1 Tax=Bacillus thuringiensis TaxID=1428 RepID=A0A9X7BIA1_BACTU|nr:hypothetical protein [Bacillus thuringiensis]MED4443457.1 hypothetical protein [Bacillus cereus]PEB45854.1 hypothetical protein COM82_20425 [Bacillus thuringiensis]PED24484.1 hypothetical protein CON34_20465 [Bacillus thuringiensis]PFV21022.1 hypothetical protein COK99_32265 [Bacillus thuringiensis]PGN21290.1 hypothetical protein CN969_18505 [Bacillus thuringiensis]
MNTEQLIALISALGTIVSAVFVYLTYKVYKKTLDTRLYVISKIESEEEQVYDSRYYLNNYESFRGLNFEGEGFPHEDFHHNKEKWNIYIKNTGDVPATNVKLKFRINIYYTKIIYGIDSADIKEDYPEVFVSHEKEIKINYLPPNENYCIPLIYLEGEFPRATIEIEHFNCNENKFISNTVEIGSYEHPSRFLLADSVDYKKFCGVANLKLKKDVG